MRYFARVTAGLEPLAWREIEQLGEATLLGFGHRRIDFIYEGPPATLLTLKSVDDVYLFITRIYGVVRTRAALTAFQELQDINFASALAHIATIRPITNPPTYGITASHLGKRNYSRYDVEDAIQFALSQRLPWHFIPNRPDEEPLHDIELRVLIEEDWALVGIRLSDIPLHRRPYKIASQPGSLKAPVAYCLCMLADLKPTDTLLDPTCGVGTILIEASTLMTQGKLIGIDIDTHAITAAHRNSEAAGLYTEILTPNSHLPLEAAAPQQAPGTILLVEGNVRTVQLPPSSVQAVVANLPWGKQVASDSHLSALYAGVLALIEKSLDATGRAVILTDQVDTLHAALQQHPSLTLTSTMQISLFGSHPTIHLIHKH
jgi:tRNA (guanine6-N2)-methyltransferase